MKVKDIDNIAKDEYNATGNAICLRYYPIRTVLVYLVVLIAGILALAETRAIMLKNQKKWNLSDKIDFFSSPLVWYFYYNIKEVEK